MRLLVVVPICTFFAFLGVQGDHPSLRARRQAVPAILDPFGLVQRASEVVSGGVNRFREGVARVTNTLRDAGTVVQLVGEDMAEGMGQLVDALHTEAMDDENNPDRLGTLASLNRVSSREGMLEGILKLVGVNPAKWGVMAINVLIYIAEMITSSLMTEGKRSDDLGLSQLDLGTILKWLPFTPEGEVTQLVREAQDQSLPTHLITSLVATTGNTTSCIQLMVCKMAPVIWGVQKTLSLENAWTQMLSSSRFGDVVDNDASTMETLYELLPPAKEFVTYGDGCEQLFPACSLLKLGPQRERRRRHQPNTSF